MARLNKKCMVCGKEYKYCYSCPSDFKNPSWMMLFDKKECKEIFNILSMETQDKLTKEEAMEKLNQYDLSKKDSFNEKVKEHIDRVLKVEKVISESNDMEIDVIKVDEDVNNNVEEKVDQKPSTKMRYSSKKSSVNK